MEHGFNHKHSHTSDELRRWRRAHPSSLSPAPWRAGATGSLARRYNASMRILLTACLACLSLSGQIAQGPPQPKEPAKIEKGEVAKKNEKNQGSPSDALSSNSQLNDAAQNRDSETNNYYGEQGSDQGWWMIVSLLAS